MEIVNRDIPLLMEAVAIREAKTLAEEKLYEVQSSVINISQHISDMPRGGGLPSGLDGSVIRLMDAVDRYKAECLRLDHLLKKIDSIIHDIPTITMRVFVEMKYVKCMPGADIMESLKMSRRRYERAVRLIEEADSMASVKWPEKYIFYEDC